MSIPSIGSETHSVPVKGSEVLGEIKGLFASTVKIPRAKAKEILYKLESMQGVYSLLCGAAEHIPSTIPALTQGFLQGLLRAQEAAFLRLAKDTSQGILGSHRISLGDVRKKQP